MPQLPGTDLTVSDLCLGGNVFGWTADAPTSFAVLDRFLDAVDPQPAFVAPTIRQWAGDSGCRMARRSHLPQPADDAQVASRTPSVGACRSSPGPI